MVEIVGGIVRHPQPLHHKPGSQIPLGRKRNDLSQP
jgi:hypothetical protein